MRTPKITATSRDLLEAIAAGHVIGMFSSQYDSPRWRAVPAIEGTRVGQFERTDRASYYLVTDDVVSLIAGGYVAVERVGDFYTHTSPQHAEYAAAGLDDTSKRCNVVAVLTAAGREALGLAPVAELAPAAEVATPAPKPSRTRASRAARPSASAAAVASVLAFHPDQATAVHADEIGYRHSTVTATIRRMIAAGEVVATADVDGTPLYYLTEAARPRYTGPRRPWALAA